MNDVFNENKNENKMNGNNSFKNGDVGEMDLNQLDNINSEDENDDLNEKPYQLTNDDIMPYSPEMLEGLIKDSKLSNNKDKNPDNKDELKDMIDSHKFQNLNKNEKDENIKEEIKDENKKEDAKKEEDKKEENKKEENKKENKKENVNKQQKNYKKINNIKRVN